MSGVSAIDNINVGDEFTNSFHVTLDDQNAFADVSGDRNPLHLNETFARSKGFDGAVVYGALVVAKLSKIIGEEIPGQNGIWNNVTMNFNQPVFVNEAVEIRAVVDHISPGTGAVILKLAVYCEDQKRMSGKAMVMFFDQAGDAA